MEGSSQGMDTGGYEVPIENIKKDVSNESQDPKEIFPGI